MPPRWLVPDSMRFPGERGVERTPAMRMPQRRFPAPWSPEETDTCFIVRDANGQALAHVYFEEERGRRSAAHLLTHDEARRIAANIAKLPELLPAPRTRTGGVSQPPEVGSSTYFKLRCYTIVTPLLHHGDTKLGL